MERFKNYDEAREKANYEPSAKLPVGAYVCKILNVRYEKGQNGMSDMIVSQIDINEGEYKEFFKTKYESDTSEDKKWKGIIKIFVPKDDGSEKDEWTRNAFAKWVAAIEDSNEGYKWDWKEEKWKNKLVGVVFGETGSVIDGKEITYTEARFGCSVEKVRDGKAPSAKFKAKNGYTGNGNNASAPAIETPSGEADEIPF